MSDMQSDRPGEPGTTEGEIGASQNDPVAPSVEGRDLDHPTTEDAD